MNNSDLNLGNRRFFYKDLVSLKAVLSDIEEVDNGLRLAHSLEPVVDGIVIYGKIISFMPEDMKVGREVVGFDTNFLGPSELQWVDYFYEDLVIQEDVFPLNGFDKLFDNLALRSKAYSLESGPKSFRMLIKNFETVYLSFFDGSSDKK